MHWDYKYEEDAVEQTFVSGCTVWHKTFDNLSASSCALNHSLQGKHFILGDTSHKL